MKSKTLIIGLSAIVIAIVLIGITRISNPTPTWGSTDIKCLVSGHQSLAQHFHPTLQIFVDGAQETVPANVGVTSACMAEAHTHDVSGTLHFESVDAGTTFTIEDFLKVWGEPLEREGHTLTATVNGEEVADVTEVILKDGDAVVLRYASGEEAVEEGGANASSTLDLQL